LPNLLPVEPIWKGRKCLAVATGPSLTAEVAATVAVSGLPVLAVSDAMFLLPGSDIGYSCDAKWWFFHKGVPGFRGERWSTHGLSAGHNDKSTAGREVGLRLVGSKPGCSFSSDPAFIYEGTNSGFQAVGIALLCGASHIGLVGFDMRPVDGRVHYFGAHPEPLRNGPINFKKFTDAFDKAAPTVPLGQSVINLTPNSALTCFTAMSLSEFLR
jgi:hypothetical protein